MFTRLKSYQVVVDIAIALVFFVFAGLYHGLGDYSDVAISLGFAFALGFRRFSPAISLAIAWVTALIQILGFGLSPGIVDFYAMSSGLFIKSSCCCYQSLLEGTVLLPRGI